MIISMVMIERTEIMINLIEKLNNKVNDKANNQIKEKQHIGF